MKRLKQLLLIFTFIIFSWLGMQVVHEAGHALVARVTGSEVIRVALHPLVFSHTDLGENPHPLAAVWGGPLFGSLFPLMLLAAAVACKVPGIYLFRFFAGFCLVANGVYIGVGWLIANGADPWVMTENGSPHWLLALFGLFTFPLGLYLWHQQGPYFGLGKAGGHVDTGAALVSAALLAALAGTEILFNSR